VHVQQLQITCATRDQLARREARHQVDEATRVGVAAHRHAQRLAARILQRAARHVDRLQRLVAVVEIQRRERQHQRSQRLRRTVGRGRVEQRQLPGGMAQPRGDLRLVLAQAFGIDAVAALLLVLQHRQRQRHQGQRQQREQAA